MEKLNLPEYSFQIKNSEKDQPYILDVIRKKYVLLTPEEWVRQHILRYLTEEKGFPVSLISVEAGVKVNRLKRRYDALIRNRYGDPLVLVECKSPTVQIRQATFDQVVAYNHSIKAGYLLITNGLKHYFCKLDPENRDYSFMDSIPLYENL
jgi:hypothetical protein